jgi:hypothetical protein
MSNELFKSKEALEKRKSSILGTEEGNMQQAKKIIPDFEESVISEHDSDSHSLYEKELVVRKLNLKKISNQQLTSKVFKTQ